MENQSLKNDKLMIYEQKKDMRQIRWLIFWVMLSLNVISLTISAIFSFMPLPTPAYLNYTRMAVTHILAVMIPIIIFFKVSGVNTQKINLRLNPIKSNHALLIIILGISGQFLMAAINAPMAILQYYLFPTVPIANVVPSGGLEILFGIIAIAVIPSILEEVMFRGIIFGGMEKQSTIFAAMFSTFVFALLHPNNFNFFGYLFLGIITVSVMLRTNSLYAAILLHVFNNLTAFMLEFLSNRGMIDNIILLLLCAIVVFIITMFIFKTVTPNAPKNKQRNAISLLFQNIFSVPIILCILIPILIQIIHNRGWLS